MADHQQPPRRQRELRGVSVAGDLVIGDNAIFIGVLQDYAGTGDSFAQQVLRAYDAQSRETLLDALGRYLDGMEEHSLQRELRRGYGRDIQLPLTLTTSPNLVHARSLHPWERHPKPVGAMDLFQLFREVEGLLLLVGGPGAGKTTSVTRLLRMLVAQARRDVGAEAYGQLPLLLPLSERSRKPKLSFEDWVAEEASERYNVAATTVGGWLRTGQLILLLDDLTGMPDEQRVRCVAEINELRTRYGSNRLLVACRPEDLPDRPKLRLRAVQIDPLAPTAVEQSLAALGQAGAGLRAAYTQSPSLHLLLRVPLMLTLAAIAFRDRVANEITPPRSADNARDYLLNAYVEVMVHAQERDQDFGVEETLHYTASLAGVLQRTGSRELLSLPDPAWLPKGRARAWLEHGLRPSVAVAATAGAMLMADYVVGALLAILTGAILWYALNHLALPASMS